MTRVSSLLFEDIERLYALRSRSATVECDSGAREFAGAGGVAKTFCLVGGNRVTINTYFADDSGPNSGISDTVGDILNNLLCKAFDVNE
jgi:hypothetical protein